MTTPTPLPQALFLAGLAAWGGVAFAAAVSPLPLPPAPSMWIFSVLWLALLFARPGSRYGALGVVAAQSLCTVAMVVLRCNLYEGLLFIYVAAQLGVLVDRRTGLAWIAAQSIVHIIAITWRWSFEGAAILAVPYTGFQVLAFTTVQLFIDERRSREALAAANDALCRAQAELVDKGRIEERLRLAHDLHDSLGHNLAALTLNLELAAHTADGAVRRMVRSAQALARALLLEVKSIVRRSGDEAPVDFVHEMRRMAHDLPRPKVHFACVDDIDLSDPRVGRALLRASQEIVTNAIRHSEAENLWIDICTAPGSIRLTARDDGKAIDIVTEGYGLTGMRRRFEELGGSLCTTVTSGGGFEVRGELPKTVGAERAIA